MKQPVYVVVEDGSKESMRSDGRRVQGRRSGYEG